jgi:phosphotriesterase-related protein
MTEGGVIQTVTGPIAPETLGVTYMHEHILCDQRRCRVDGLRPRGRDADLMMLTDPEAAVQEMAELKRLGAGAVVEVTMQAWGRDLRELRRISTAAGLSIIATSGFYVEACHPASVAVHSVAQLADELIREITDDAEGTGIRTGLLKAAISRPVVEGPEEKCARAVAIAQRRTGAAITTHTSGSARFEIPGGNIGWQLLDLFESEGVDQSRVIVGHVDENADLRHLEALCRRGAYVQFDVIGKRHWMLDETRADLIAALVDQGYVGHLLLSTDRNRESELTRGGGVGYGHLLTRFIPMLEAAGVDRTAIRAMLVDNPRRVLPLTNIH